MRSEMKIKNYNLKIGNKTLLKNINFEIQPHMLNVLIGQNGVGKTLILNLISNLDNNRPIEFIDFPKSKDIIYQTQGVPFIAEVTIRQTIKLLMKISGGHSEDINLKNLPDIVKKNLDIRFGNLSGGERRFVVIWAILHINRDLYILDEPFSNLDPLIMKQLMDIIYEKINQGKTIILTTHQYDDIKIENTYVTFFRNQGIDFTGTMKNFVNNYSSLRDAFF